LSTVSIEGARVLVVEDESMVGVLMEDLLAEVGCDPVGTAWGVQQALAMLDMAPVRLVVLDANIAGKSVEPVAEELARRGIPFIFVTGFGVERVPEAYRDRPILMKPVEEEELRKALMDALSSVEPGAPEG
jgi:DNA-binding NtrC family response regulator